MKNEYGTIADEKWELESEAREVREELMRLALAQNPELAQRLMGITSQLMDAKARANQQRIQEYREWKAKHDEEERRRNPPKISYDYKRNMNALKGLRRSSFYKGASRLEQIEMEIEEYYEPHEQPIPPELLEEHERLIAEEERKANANVSASA